MIFFFKRFDEFLWSWIMYYFSLFQPQKDIWKSGEAWASWASKLVPPLFRASEIAKIHWFHVKSVKNFVKALVLLKNWFDEKNLVPISSNRGRFSGQDSRTLFWLLQSNFVDKSPNSKKWPTQIENRRKKCEIGQFSKFKWYI